MLTELIRSLVGHSGCIATPAAAQLRWMNRTDECSGLGIGKIGSWAELSDCFRHLFTAATGSGRNGAMETHPVCSQLILVYAVEMQDFITALPALVCR